MKIGVVIVNYNGKGYIADCLRSLRASTRQPDTVVCVDNASVDGSPDLIEREFPEVVLLRSAENTGFTGGVNLGARHCVATGHDAVLLLNPDAVLLPETLERIVDAASRHAGAVIAPAIRLFVAPHVWATYAGHVRWWGGRIGLMRETRQEQRVTTAGGCCLLIPADILRQVGFMDESYFLYFEDADLLERVVASGRRIWHVPSAVVLHKESSATGGRMSPLALYYFVRNRHHFVRKHRGTRAVYAAFIAYSLLDVAARLVRCLLAGRRDLALASIRGAMDAWRGRIGKSDVYDAYRAGRFSKSPADI